MNLEKSIVEHCSPTLAGIKTANLFTVKFNSVQQLDKNIEKIQSYFDNSGISLRVLRQRENTALIYLFRIHMLENDLKDKNSVEILNRYGYKNLTVSQSVDKLSERLGSIDEFPHEIGLFLGYPPQDVEGFICNNGKNCNLCGYWKVYGDTEEALAKFAKYDKCRMVYKRLWLEGRDIMRLTVKKQSAVA